MLLDGGEIADAARGIHLPYQTIPHLRGEARAEFILPFLERPRRRDLETVEEGTVDAHVAGAQMVDVNVNPARGQTDGGTLNHHGLARDLCLDDRQTLGERVIGELRRGLRPQQVGEIVARELLARFQGETNEEGEVLARTEPHWFAGNGEQGGTTQAAQNEGLSHMPARVLLIQ